MKRKNALVEEVVELAAHHAEQSKRGTKKLTKSQLETLADESYWNALFPALENRGVDTEGKVQGATLEEHYIRAFVEAFQSKPTKSTKAKKAKPKPPVLELSEEGDPKGKTLAAVKAYVESGADVNELIERGEVFMESLLHLAAANHHVAIMEYLLEHGADPNLGDGTMGEFPIHRAIAFGDDPKAAEVLLDHGADPNRPALNGGPPLNDAILMGHVRTVELLVARGAKTGPEARAYCDDLIKRGGPKDKTYRLIARLLR
jgi:hypothetical protein